MSTDNHDAPRSEPDALSGRIGDPGTGPVEEPDTVSDKVRAAVLREEAQGVGGLTGAWMRERAQQLDPLPPVPQPSLLEQIANAVAEFDALPEWDRPILPAHR